MSIIYALISKDFDCVLCEYSEFTGNFQQITRIILRKISSDSKKTIDYAK